MWPRRRRKSLIARHLPFVSLALVLVTVVLLATLTGCTKTPSADSGGAKPEDKETPEGQKATEGESAPSAGDKVALTLYFPDSQAEHLVREVREVTKGDTGLPDLVIKELVKGPTALGLGGSIPKEAQLVSPVKIEDGVAYVDFNKEFQSKHWGGSTGEIMTIYSIVNSLTELEGIKSVVFLIEGKPLDSLAGHMDLTGPVERNEDLISG